MKIDKYLVPYPVPRVIKDKDIKVLPREEPEVLLEFKSYEDMKFDNAIKVDQLEFNIKGEKL